MPRNPEKSGKSGPGVPKLADFMYFSWLLGDQKPWKIVKGSNLIFWRKHRAICLRSLLFSHWFFIKISCFFHPLPKPFFFAFWPPKGAKKSPYLICWAVFGTPMDFQGSPKSPKIVFSGAAPEGQIPKNRIFWFLRYLRPWGGWGTDPQVMSQLLVWDMFDPLSVSHIPFDHSHSV